MSDRKYQLKDLFAPDFINTVLNVYGLSPVNVYPELTQVLTTYRNMLRKTPRHRSSFRFGETFRQKIFYNDENFYVLSWSIAKVKKVIAQRRPPLRQFALKEIIEVVDPACINESHLNFALTNNKPVFIASYPPLAAKNKFLVIDGNHRVYSKFRDRQDTIPGFWLEPEQHLQAMGSELDRNLFKLHFDYYMIASYIGGLMSKKELEKSLYYL